MAAVMVSAPGCKRHRTSAPDASAPAPHITKNKSNLVDWRTACALGKAIGLPTSGALPGRVIEEGPPNASLKCAGLVHNGARYQALGYTQDGAAMLQIAGSLASASGDAPGPLTFADRLTEKVLGQPVPPTLRKLARGTKKSVIMKGWRLEMLTNSNGVEFGYTIYPLRTR